MVRMNTISGSSKISKLFMQNTSATALPLLAITPEWLIPMSRSTIQSAKQELKDTKNQNGWLSGVSLVIKNEVILDIIATNKLFERYPNCEELKLPGYALMPGMINAHCHAAMNLLRGYSDDLPLKQWLEQAIWPVEVEFVDDEFVYNGSLLAIAEMLKSGTTCFQDMYFMPDQIAKAVQHAGIRANIGLMVVDAQTAWAKDAEECISKGLAVFDQFKHDSRLSFSFAPHAPYTVSPQTLQKISTLSYELSLNIHMHIHETQNEVIEYEKQHGLSPIAMMYQNGLLSPQLNAVHMTHLAEHEIEWIAQSGTHVIHCPHSNMKLASGICPVAKLLDNGVNVAIGTDGAASNNDLNMLSELKTAALLAKLNSMSPSVLSAEQALYAATMGGAKALGIDSKVGSFKIGKQADVIAINLNNLETQPVYNPISQIVYSASREHVEHVWVAGKQLLKNNKLTSLNENQLIKIAQQWQAKIEGFKND
jgi:5-methylthioadenosine/S-adenosylhomocysteine deaminase